MSEKNEIWFDIRRLYLTENGPKEREIKCIEVDCDITSEELKNEILTKFNLDNDLILKVRNERESLVPISKGLINNNYNKQRPYVLELVRRHQTVHCQSRSVQLDCYNETMKIKLLDVINRIEKLESACPQLKSKREAKIHAELQDIDKKLNFLNKRLTEADGARWDGMFQKNPLW